MACGCWGAWKTYCCGVAPARRDGDGMARLPGGIEYDEWRNVAGGTGTVDAIGLGGAGAIGWPGPEETTGAGRRGAGVVGTELLG